MSKWISVKDRLPPANRYVVVWSKEEGLMSARYDNEKSQWVSLIISLDTTITLTVTHWMPLPIIPEINS